MNFNGFSTYSNEKFATVNKGQAHNGADFQKKVVRNTLITTYGLKKNTYSGIFSNVKTFEGRFIDYSHNFTKLLYGVKNSAARDFHFP